MHIIWKLKIKLRSDLNTLCGLKYTTIDDPWSESPWAAHVSGLYRYPSGLISNHSSCCRSFFSKRNLSLLNLWSTLDLWPRTQHLNSSLSPRSWYRSNHPHLWACGRWDAQHGCGKERNKRWHGEGGEGEEISIRKLLLLKILRDHLLK